MSNASLAWFWFALGSAGFAALTNIFAKVGVEGIPSNMATWVRVVVILVVASILVVARGEWQSPAAMPNKTLVFLLLSGIATGLSWLCFFRALQLADASLVAPVDKLSVVLVMLFGYLFLKEKLGWQQWLGGFLILAGVLLVAKKPAEATKAPDASAPTAPAATSN
ncbi:MAG: EamA family transporter [Planctomycetota bacterium]|nr:EamA family transporter [Planctomycetota bacterium]